MQQKLHLFRITLQDAANSPMLHVIREVCEKKRLLQKSWPAMYFMAWMALGNLRQIPDDQNIPVKFSL